jgi:HSP20 family molecular chaperone IbpA
MPHLGKTSPADTRDLTRREREHGLSRGDWLTGRDPFAEIFRRFGEAFDAWPFAAAPARGAAGSSGWRPQVEAFQRGDEFVVRADLPGLEKKDVSVEVQDDALVITGERTDERQQEERGYYSTERRYGQFCRVVPLPDGAIADSVTASFKNGVLEVVTKAPPHEVSRGRRVEIG